MPFDRRQAIVRSRFVLGSRHTVLRGIRRGQSPTIIGVTGAIRSAIRAKRSPARDQHHGATRVFRRQPCQHIVFGAAQPPTKSVPPPAAGSDVVPEPITIERAQSGKPHAGKVLATIAPHSDDHSILAGGTIAKLIEEGYTGYLIRTSNDEKDSADLSSGQTIAANEADNQAMAKVLGIKQVFDLGYRNHRMDDVSRVEMRARLIFLIRLLKIDTIFSYDPWGHYEENPDHYVTAQCVEAACWMAGGHLDFPEHFAAGLKPHAVSEKYYYARGPQAVNRVVDISTHDRQEDGRDPRQPDDDRQHGPTSSATSWPSAS